MTIPTFKESIDRNSYELMSKAAKSDVTDAELGRYIRGISDLSESLLKDVDTVEDKKKEYIR